MNNRKLVYFIASMLVFLAYALQCGAGEAAKDDVLYIDIVKAPRRLPVAIQELSGPYGDEIANIVAGDLEQSGFFAPLPTASHTERPDQPFRKTNWAGTGAEIVMKGSVKADAELTVSISLYDVVEGKLIFEKDYTAGRTLIRPLAHAAASDIYRKLTGSDPVFRQKLLYVIADPRGYRLAVSDWDGERVIDPGISADMIVAPRWSPDGRSIAYSATRGRRWGIYRTILGESREELLLQTGAMDLVGDFFPNSKRIALSSSREISSDIYVLDLTTMELVRVTQNPGIEVSPSVSPDGTRMVFVSDRTGSPQIYTMDGISYNISRLTYEGRYNTSPNWSPMGDMIAFSGQVEGKNQIFTIRPDGSGLRMLTSEGNNEDPCISSDGRFIAFTSDRDGGRSVFVMRSNGDGQHRITRAGINARSPRWSPR